MVELLNNCLVFFVSGLILKNEEKKQVLNYRGLFYTSLAIINIITTLLALELIRLNYLTKDFATNDHCYYSTFPRTLNV